jgi:hypothetical protein
MKTIFRYTNIAFLLAAIVGFGAVIGSAQDACGDAEGQLALSDKFREEFPKKDLPGRKSAIDTGKQFLEKYGACESAKDFTDYLKGALPALEKNYKALTEGAAKEALYNRFNAAVKASNFDEVYTSGKEILAKEPDQLDVIISLGSIGYDESYKRNFKFNDETIRFANQAISALEAGKIPKTYGLFQWTYKDKENALGWLNYTIGYIRQVAQKDKKAALPYLYKATQLESETKKNPIPYELIGGYYFDELNKLADEVQAMAKGQSETDTPEVAQQKVDAIKAKVALANGTAERAMDAFARAYTLSASTPAAKPYKDKMYKNLQDAYKLRFAKTEGLDSWIAATVSKPMPNPLTAITPVFDAETKTTTSTSTPAPAPAPAVTSPAVTSPAKPAAVKSASATTGKPATAVKPPSSKTTAKKKGV